MGFLSKRTTKSLTTDGTEEWVDHAIGVDEPQQISSSRIQHSQNVVEPTSSIDDELSTRLFTSVIGIVEERRQLATSLADYKRQLVETDRMVEELKQERKFAQLRMERKEEEIEKVQRQVAEKQLKYDQLIEDYKQLRASEALERERLQQQIKEGRLNFENVNSDYSRFRSESMKDVERLEAEVREWHVKYHQLMNEYDKTREDNTHLMRNIAQFTQQMSSIRMQDQSSDFVRPPVPIRPVPAKDAGDASNL